MAVTCRCQMGLEPSNDEDDGGILVPEFMTYLTDSGAYTPEGRAGLWVEYEFSGLTDKKRHLVRYDSMVHFDSLHRYLRFYRMHGYYEKGKKVGKWKTYICYKKKLPLQWQFNSKVLYRAGLKEGWEDAFNKTGSLTGKTFYRNGLIDSIATRYFDNGVTASIFRYKMGKLHGLGQLFLPQGSVFAEVIYDAGESVGNVYYKPTGSVLMITGLHRTYFDNGALKTESNYDTKGLLDGLHRSHYPNGKIEKEMNLKKASSMVCIKHFMKMGSCNKR